jgi:hypothetical protein
MDRSVIKRLEESKNGNIIVSIHIFRQRNCLTDLDEIWYYSITLNIM